jgi:hypothetical protein
LIYNLFIDWSDFYEAVQSREFANKI